MKLYRIVPYDPEVDGSKHVFVSAREMLVPDSTLRDIAEADLRPVADLVTELRKHIEGNPGAFNSFQWAARFRSRVLALGETDEVEMGVIRCHICGYKEGEGHKHDCTV